MAAVSVDFNKGAAAMAQFEAVSSPEPDQVVVHLVGECDLAVSGELSRALAAAVATSPRVVVDLTHLTFLDSSGLNQLVIAYHAAIARGGHIQAMNASGVVAELLTLTGIGELLGPPTPVAQDSEARHG